MAAALLCGCTPSYDSSETNNTAEEIFPPDVSASETESIQTVSENIIGSEALECRYYSEMDFLLYDSTGE